MRFTFLGTAAGMPARDRNVSGLALAAEQQRPWHLIDCGEGTQHQLLRSAYTAAKLRAIFITHVHGDHCYGLPGLLASAQMGGRDDPLTVCAPAGVAEFIEAACRYTDFTPVYPLRFVRSDRPDFRYEDDDLIVTSVPLSHRVPSFAYRFEERVRERHLDPGKLEQLGIPRGPLWGALQQGRRVELADGRIVDPEQACLPQRRPRCVVAGGDNDRPELLRDALVGCDLLIHEATYTEDVLARVGPAYQHSTAAQVAKVAAAAQLPWLALTHFSHRYRRRAVAGGHSLLDLENEARQHYTGGLIMADDLHSYVLDREGQLHRETAAGGMKTVR